MLRQKIGCLKNKSKAFYIIIDAANIQIRLKLTFDLSILFYKVKHRKTLKKRI